MSLQNCCKKSKQELLPATFTTLTVPRYSSAKKVFVARTSDVASHTEMISHSIAIYDGKFHPGTSLSMRIIGKIIHHELYDTVSSTGLAVAGRL